MKTTQRGLRAPERLFRTVLWIVAIVFAGFLIGLGSLVVEDLPTVDGHRTLQDFVDHDRADAADAAIATLEASDRPLVDRLASLELQQKSAHASYTASKQAFDNWIATRTSTQRADQDPEVLHRTHELDELSNAARTADVAVERVERDRLDIAQRLAARHEDREALDAAAEKPYRDALRAMELRVFLIRLAITLPPLAVAGWLFVRHRRSRWWPFVWGFVLFALYAFFVELVPYLPSYGGYVRYLVGILVTIAVGRYAIVGMQRYLERQRAAERQSESVRRQSLSYEHAIKSMGAGICPGCERGFKVHEGQTDYCMHCGMKLFEACPACTARKNAFFHYCPSCGTGKPIGSAPGDSPATGTVVEPVA